MASRFSAEQQQQYLQAAKAKGADDAYIDDYLARNPDDFNRLEESIQSTDHRPYDSQSSNPREQAANRAADAGMGGGAPSRAQGPTAAWLNQPSSAPSGVSAMFSELMSRTPSVDRTNPNVRAQSDAFRAQGERARRNYLGDLAEREGPLANIRGEERMSAERLAQSAGGFEAELIGRELEAERQDILQRLQLFGSMLNAEQRMALEERLAILNDQARTADRNAGISEGALNRNQAMDQFLRELGLREWSIGLDDDYRWGMGV